MENIDAIIDDGCGHLETVLRRAFDAGRAVGRREVADEMKAKLVGFVKEFEPPTVPASGIGYSQTEAFPEMTAIADGGARAIPGTVKPAIANMVILRADGITTEEIVKRTGFKPNSVRGTLWTLGKEGEIENRNGRWYGRPRAGRLMVKLRSMDQMAEDADEAPAQESSAPVHHEDVTSTAEGHEPIKRRF